MKPKIAVVIGDGMADFALDELGGRTPLEVADKPAMDALARGGIQGLAWNVPAHLPAGSDVAIMSIMGYDPEEHFTGRGPLEAASMGLAVKPGQTVFRCNVINVAGPTLVDYSSGHITTEEAAELVKDLNEKNGLDTAKFYPGISYRHILIVDGDFSKVETFAPHDHMDEPWEKYLPCGENAEALVRLIRGSAETLEDHPVNRKRRGEGKRAANLIWLWGGGAMPLLQNYQERYGLTGAVISAVDLVRGLGVLAGLESIAVEGATGLVDTNYEGKLEAAISALECKDFVCLHLEGCDEAAHEGNIALKIRGIEELDRRIVAPLAAALEKFDDFRLLIMPDHATPIPLRTHNWDPVPFIIHSKRGAKKSSGLSYSEKNGLETGVKFSRGCELLPYVFNLPE